MKLEQRATRDDTHDLKMPRQGVSFLNDSLGLGGHRTRRIRSPKPWTTLTDWRTRPRKLGNNVSTPDSDP